MQVRLQILVCTDSSPSFVNMHCKLTFRKNNPRFVFKGYHDGKSSRVICSIGYDKLLSSMNEFDDAVVDMDYPFKVPEELFDIGLLGCFNGVFFLENYSKNTFCLWNPATKEYKDIPTGLPELDRGGPKIYFRTDVYGFGDDYKVVYIYKDVDKGISIANIYTLGSNSWKSIQTVPYLFPCNQTDCSLPFRQRLGVFLNGAFHWLGKTRDTYSSNVIVLLDMRHEKFKELQLPKESLENKHSFLSMGEVKGCLFVLVEVVKVRVEVWVMQDYGVQESWTKRYIITHERILKMTYYMQLMWVFENGEILFAFNNEVGVYDPKSGSYDHQKPEFIQPYPPNIITLKA